MKIPLTVEQNVQDSEGLEVVIDEIEALVPRRSGDLRAEFQNSLLASSRSQMAACDRATEANRASKETG
jgi:hypothetical protein